MKLSNVSKWFCFPRSKRETIYREGIAYYNNGSFDEALDCFSLVLKKTHSSGSIEGRLASFFSGMSHCNLGVLSIYSGDYARSVENLQAAINFIPEQYAPFYYLGIAYHNLGQLDEAMASFAEVMKLNPDFLPVHSQVAILFYNEAKYQEAQSELEKIVSQNPMWADMRFHLALIKASQGDHRDGLKELETALGINPNYLKARIMRGVFLAYLGQAEKGAAILETVAAERPHFPDVVYYLGLIYGSMGRINQSRAALEKAIELNPQYTDAHFCLGMVRLAGRLYPESRQSFENVLALKPSHAEARLFLQKAEQISNESATSDEQDSIRKLFVQALEVLPRHQEIYPDFSDIVNIFSPSTNRGLYLSLVQFYEATAIKTPHYADVHDTLGSLHAKLGSFDRAADCYRRALNANPRFIRARINLYKMLLSRNKPREALTEIEILFEQGLKFPDMLLDLGRTLKTLGRPEEAIISLTQAVAMNSTMKPVYILWAQIEEELGRLSRAADVIERLLLSMGDTPEAAQYRDWLSRLRANRI